MDFNNGYSQEYLESRDGESQSLPEQTFQLRYPPSSTLSNTSHVFSTISDPPSGYEQTVWCTPDAADLMELGSLYTDAYTGPASYNNSMDFNNSELLSYDGSYGPAGYTNARALTTDLQLQPPGLQVPDLEPSVDFSSDYSGIGLDSMDDWYKGLDYGDSPMASNSFPDGDPSYIWTSQDLKLLANQYGSPFSVGSPCSSQVQNQFVPRNWYQP
ncbi:hypothetical protein PISL3812_08668 [Talaromyces islandicus]|uniref:Uncharacterized protein n=1 Tax=Talaromyces islandicus TaxID=28573 RepID=A0A0U1M7W3_TALIS|nr:hypothetical protein PISL3812_08668 [Talaromyces islandicus]